MKCSHQLSVREQSQDQTSESFPQLKCGRTSLPRIPPQDALKKHQESMPKKKKKVQKYTIFEMSGVAFCVEQSIKSTGGSKRATDLHKFMPEAAECIYVPGTGG